MHRPALLAVLTGLVVLCMMLALHAADPDLVRATHLSSWIGGASAGSEAPSLRLQLLLAAAAPLPAFAVLAASRPALALLLAAATVAGIAAGAAWLGRHAAVVLDATFPALACAVAVAAAVAIFLLLRHRAEAALRTAFRGSLARPFLARIAGGADGVLRAASREVTVLHIVLGRSRAPGAELAPETQMRRLDRTLAPLAGRLRETGAYTTVDAGGAVTALWNAPVAREDHVQQAARSALEVQALAASLAASLDLAFHSPGAPAALAGADLSVGIGIGTGACLTGASEAARPTSYLVAGPAMHEARRLAEEALAANLPILLSEPMAKAVSGFALLTIEHAGRALTTLVGDADMARSRDFRALKPLLAELEANLKIKATADVRANLDELGKRPCSASSPGLAPLIAHYRARSA